MNISSFLQKWSRSLGYSAWTYKEGRNRNIYVVEFTRTILKDFKICTLQEKIDYIRGYFDAEGGIAKSVKVRFYIYFAQKNKSDLEEVKQYLEEADISCGIIHNPSKKTDPDYWRFFIRNKSYDHFIRTIGSWHPEKRHMFRMKI